MEDPQSLFGIYGSPTLDEIFGPAAEPLPDLPPGAPVVDQDRVSDFGEAGPSGTQDDGPGDQNGTRTLQVWPAPPPAFDCNFCLVLREIVHVHYGYKHYTKLEIHGGVGVISHAILERKFVDVFGDGQFEMVDFSNKSAEEVKNFLVVYCLQRSEEGYIMSDDPLLLFYEALCACLPLRSQTLHNAADFVVNPPQNYIPGGGLNYQNMVQQQEHEQEQANEPGNRRRRARNPRIPLSEQRKRTAALTLQDVGAFFHFALADAAKRLEVCSTVLKKICRRDGIPRWPYRKVDSVKKKIEALQRNLTSSHAAVRADAQQKIYKLRQEAANACGGLTIL